MNSDHDIIYTKTSFDSPNFEQTDFGTERCQVYQQYGNLIKGLKIVTCCASVDDQHDR